MGAQAIFLGVALSVAGWVIRPTRLTLMFALLGLFIEIGWFVLWFVLLSAVDRVL